MSILVKSNIIPPSLVSSKAQNERAALDAMVQNAQNPKSEDFKYSIYGADDVRRQILEDQHHKCAYCGDYMRGRGEVDHFRPKAQYRQGKNSGASSPAYYWLAYEWNNLIGACHGCNTRKGSFFPLRDDAVRNIAGKNYSREQPLLINPYVEDLNNFIEYWGPFVRPKKEADGSDNEKGKATIDFLGLADREDLFDLRLRAWAEFKHQCRQNNWTYQQALQNKIQAYAQINKTEEDIEFLDMYKNQQMSL